MGKTRAGNNRGFTLVEIVCVIAIFSLVTVTAGAVMVFSSRSYRNSTSETSVQQEAQFTANRIGGLIQDATEVVVYNEADPNPNWSERTNRFEIIRGEISTYVISFVKEDENKPGVLYYETLNADGAEPAEGGEAVPKQLLAENIEHFWVKYDKDKFQKTKTVELAMTVNDGIKNYNVAYTMTARNDEVTPNSGGSTVEPICQIRPGSRRVVMVPGETLTLDDIELVGVTAIKQPDQASYADTGIIDEVVVGADNSVTIKLKEGKDISRDNDNAIINLESTDLKDGSPAASAQITVYIRRVKAIKDEDMQITSGKDADGNKVYTFYANPEVVNASRIAGADWDKPYHDPYAVSWDYELRNYSDETDYTEVNVDDYFEKLEDSFTPGNSEGSVTIIPRPYIKFKQKKPLTSTMQFCVTATSRHAAGENKGNHADPGIHYDDISGTATLKGTGYNTKTIEMILEPGESRDITISGLDEKLAWECTPSGGSLKTGTSFTIEEKNKLHIVIGEGETGYDTPDTPVDGIDGIDMSKGEKSGNIIVDVHPAGAAGDDDVALRVLVGIRRVTKIELSHKMFTTADNNPNAEKPAHVQNTPLLKNADYQFYTKVYGTHLDLTADEVSKGVENPYAVKFSFEFYLNGEKEDECSDSCEWIEYNEGGDKPGGSLNKKYSNRFTLIDLGVNKYGDGGSANHPCINFRLIDDFPAGGELRVKAESKHALYDNKYGEKGNKQDYIAEDSLAKGAVLVVVEPNQGREVSGTEVKVPVVFSGTPSTIKDVHLNGASSDTKKLKLEKKDSHTWNVYVQIGRDEKGKDNTGLFSMDVTAADGEIQTVTFAVRRVKGITVTAEDKSGNTAGGTLKLAAMITGYAEPEEDSGYAPYYFPKQKVEFGTYIDPCQLEWSYLLPNAGSKWVVIKDGGDYVKSFVTDNGLGTVQTIKLTLNKAFPKGTIIRAHSLHAGNPSLEDKIDSNQNMNTTGLYYDNVNGEYKIEDASSVIFIKDFLRGNDNFFFDKNKYPNEDFPYTDVDQNSLKWFMRVREVKYVNGERVCGEWSTYRRTIEDSKDAKKLNARETASFLPDKGYEIEMALMSIDKDKKIINWPYDESLNDEGTGFEEFSLGWTDSKVTDERDYKSRYEIGPVELQLKDDNGKSETYLNNLGSKDNPKVLHKGDENTIRVSLQGTAIELGHFQDALRARIEMLKDEDKDIWEEIAVPSGMSIQGGGLTLPIKYDQNYTITPGTYRISFDLADSSNWTQWKGRDYIFTPFVPADTNANKSEISGYENIKYSYPLYDGTNGYIYIKIVD